MALELIGMLDSPYVRRVAVSLHLMGLPFVRRPVSVFGGFDAFRTINPVVKAPTLVADGGEVLMDSTLILAYLETRVPPERRLTPTDPIALRRSLRLTGLALAACEKAVQVVYERQLRPAERQHQPWLDRVQGQLLAACGELESELERHPLRWDASAGGQPTDAAGVSVAVAWHFIQQLLPGLAAPGSHRALAAWSAQAEPQPAFRAAPHEEG